MSMSNRDYLTLNKVVVNLNDAELALQLFERLKEENDEGLSAQIAFDLVSSASQQLLEILVTELTTQGYDSGLLNILSGLPTCDYYNTCLLYTSRCV